MKLINKILCGAMALASVAGMTSCDDMLDTKPNGSFTPNEITEEQVPDLMTGAYATLMNHFLGNNEAFAAPINNWVADVRSDDALKGGGSITMEGDIHQLEVGNVQSDYQAVNYKWRNCYFAIARCNVAIRAIKNAESLDNKEVLLAELKTLRALWWFDMYRYFQKFPFFDEETVDPSSVRAIDRTSPEIINAIKTDLRDAYRVLPERQEQVARFNKYVAAALLARVDLYTHDFAEAETYADHVIQSGLYDLYPNFLDMSKPEFNNSYEAVLAVQFSSANSPDQYNFNNCLNCTYSEGNLYGNGDDFYLASQNLVNAFRTDANGLPYLDTFNDVDVNSASYSGNVDPRLDFTVGRIGMPWRSSAATPHIYNMKWTRAYDIYGEYSGKKYYTSPESPYVEVGIVPWGASSLNMLLIRYADVMLMKAEALVEQNKDLEEAKRLVNLIRKRAYDSMDPSYTPIDIDPMTANYAVGQYASFPNQEFARKAVRMERRLELAMEGQRWFDLVRWGVVTEVVNNYYVSEARHHSYYQGAHLSESSIYFPVPKDQLDNSNGLYK